MKPDNPKVSALAPWFDKMKYAIALVKDGTLRIDGAGQVWRYFVLDRWGNRKAITPKRAERQTKKGYLSITFRVPKQRRTRSVLAHCLVWNVLYGDIAPDLQINHKDLDKTNNRPSNLELLTGAGNIQHSYAHGRTRPWSRATEWRPGIPCRSEAVKSNVRDMRASGMTYRQIEVSSGVSQAEVGRILKRGSDGI